MSASAARSVRTGDGRAWRAAAAVLATAVGMGGVAACSDDPIGPETGPAATEVQAIEERLTGIEDRLAAIEDRVGVLEDEPAAEERPEEDRPGEEEPGVLGDAEALIGQGVTVSGEVTEPVTVADVGASFRISGDSGDPIVVIMATPPAELQADDTVEVTGTVVRIAEDSFEVDFGIAADQLFEDPAAFFADSGGQIAISAARLEVVQAQAD
ncbi:hypothetical protein [Blastococcus capsensis]|uniref:hypothetical protein n=1 Tax=Blastococcus capsensis TaxID=1564163 RepID=UPI00253FC58B|nr:hypothetical protein [Blastococcus capsensis]MDK3255764.1 hypothetical protein [Blastococcus capsensis]